LGPGAAACRLLAREVLSQLAAERWQVPVGEVKLADGLVVHPASGRDATFAALTKGQKLVETVSDLPATPPEQWQYAGQSRRKTDGAAIVTGQHVYPADVVRPGMWHGKVLRPPAMGSKLTEVDTSAAEAMEGVKVVKDGDFIGVAAVDEHRASQAIDAIKATWTAGSGPPQERLIDILRPQPVKPLSAGQDAVVWSATYTVQYIAHVPLEPRAAVAEAVARVAEVAGGRVSEVAVVDADAGDFTAPEALNRAGVVVFGTGDLDEHGMSHHVAQAARQLAAAQAPPEYTWGGLLATGAVLGGLLAIRAADPTSLWRSAVAGLGLLALVAAVVAISTGRSELRGRRIDDRAREIMGLARDRHPELFADLAARQGLGGDPALLQLSDTPPRACDHGAQTDA